MDAKQLTNSTKVRPEYRHLPISFPLHLVHPLLRQLPPYLQIIIQSLQAINHYQIVSRVNPPLLTNASHDQLRDVRRTYDRIRPPEDQHRHVVKRSVEGGKVATGIRPVIICFVSFDFLRRGRKILRQPNMEWQSDPCRR